MESVLVTLIKIMKSHGNRRIYEEPVTEQKSDDASVSVIERSSTSTEGTTSPERAEQADQGSSYLDRSLLTKIGIALLAILWIGFVAANWADAAETKESAEAGAHSKENGDEYSFNWLDPEKKIYVLQNRRYTKAGKLLVSLMGGPGLSNPYRTTYNLDPRLAFFLSEDWGIEGFYTTTFNSNNNTFRALTTASPNTLPVVREFKSEYGALLHWVPWYAKINIFNKILYFDWYFALGAGMVQDNAITQNAGAASPTTTGESAFAVVWATGQIFHVSDTFSVRLDLTNHVYNASVFGPGQSNTETSWYTNTNLSVGLGITL